MNQRTKSVANTLIMVLPFLWSFLTQSNLNSLLKLNIVCPVVLAVLFIFALSDRDIKSDREIYLCIVLFGLFFAYSMIICGINKSPFELLNVFLTMSAIFSYIHYGENIKFFWFIGYGYAAVSFVILFDFISGGITAGWNTNSIGMISVNGIYFLLLSIAVDNGRFKLIKLGLSLVILLLITVTGCRSVLFGIGMYVIVRLFLLKKNISKGYFYTLIAVLTAAPYLVMRLYLSLYNSPNADKLNQISFKYTGKVLFTERELIWNSLFKKFVGIKYWFGNGKIIPGNAHNLYVDIWYTLGLIGVIFFAVLIFFCVSRAYKYLDDPIIKSAVCCFYGMLFSQTFECSYFSVTNITFNAILYMFIAIILGRYLKLKNEDTE